MIDANDQRLTDLLAILFRAHPWHGVAPGASPEIIPATLNTYIEIVPADAVKYELDKASGHLRLDRPQRYSSMCPTLYGFIPQTFCGASVGEFCQMQMSARTDAYANIQGDGDPLDICVLTEKGFTHGNFLVRSRPIGGMRMIDGNEADDKIIAVLENDITYGDITDIAEVPVGLLDRLQHYFLTYKQLPSAAPRHIEITDIYDRAEAHEVIRRSLADYREIYGAPEDRISELRRLLAFDKNSLDETSLDKVSIANG